MLRREATAACLSSIVVAGSYGSAENESSLQRMIDYRNLPMLSAAGVEVRLPTLQKLFVIDEYIRDNLTLPIGYDRGVGAVGLLLERPLAFGTYWNSPDNALTFAYTGGEGDHYSLLIRDGIVDENSPVVMTWPTSPEDDLMTIVGESLKDFLSFGLRTGYFCVYGDQRWTPPERVTATWQFPLLENSEKEVLDLLSQELGLKPWPVEDYQSRLLDLQNRFLHLVQWSEE